MSPKKWLVIFVLLTFLLPGFKALAQTAAICAMHGEKCTATCKEKKTCRLNKGTCRTGHEKHKHKKAAPAGENNPSFKSCKHETSPVNVLSVKELPGGRFFSPLYLTPEPEDLAPAHSNLYRNPLRSAPERPPQPRFS